MPKIAEMSILYGSAPTYPSEEEIKNLEEMFKNIKKEADPGFTPSRSPADDKLAILVRERGERAFFEGDEALANACRELWRRLTA